MGATFVVKLPDIGEGIVEAELVGWHVQVGDAVSEDQVIAEVMTDKATVEIPAPCAGTVTALGGEVGEKLVVGSELLRLEAPAARQAAEPASAAPEPARPEPAAAAAAPAAETPRLAPQPAPAASHAPQRSVLCSPAVRRRAHDLGLDLSGITGTGPEGRILHADLDAVLLRGRRPPVSGDEVQELPVIGLRRRIAERMADSARRVAHFSYVEEVDVTALEELRATLNAEPGIADRPRLTPLPFLALAVMRAVAEFPQMNAHYHDEANLIRRMRAVHLGIATQTANGLMVPVMRHAERLTLWDCADGIRRVAEAARDGSAKREELGGSTITITSLGPLGGLASTPIVNAPEVAIIGTNRIATRPVWQEGVGVVPRRMMNLSSSFDHRVIDGHDAAVFVRRIKALLETPSLLFVPDRG
ncbi:dihydrolipoamide acetyltransferase family protein [Falsiroseomonas sp. HW251]|uniref:dihydrolipoamide acetyltransferase family protein n=1 Tax=Falsiroseomonas sp. HW251 TaxID=3390998 RepID=UPI003D31478F